jgi:outer membrane protein insertion porin family
MKVLFPYLIVAFLLLSGCTALKYVPQEEQLYTGATVKIKAQNNVTAQKEALSATKDVVRPKPNRKIFKSRPYLWLYYVTGPLKKEKGFKYWLKIKIGEPPVYMSLVDPGLVSKAMDAQLYNKGFFDSYSQYEIEEHSNGKTVAIHYLISLAEPYKYNDIIFPKDSSSKDSSSLEKAIAKTEARSLLKKGERYDLDILLQERIRIEERLQRNGFYYFNADDILFRMDTSLGTRELKMYISIKEETSEKSKQVYRIAEVNVYPDYRLGNDTISKRKEVIDSVNFFNGTNYIRPEPVLRSVFIKNGALYDRRKHNLTLNRLNALGVFKFVNVRITDKDTIETGWLSANIFLTPLPKKSLGLELQGVSKSNNFIGPGINLSLRNRNAFKGAELMIYNISASFETQFNGQYKGQFTREINPRIELYVPRFMLPFHIPANSNYVPRTKYMLDYSYLSRVGYFNLNSLKYTFGYKWKTRLTTDQELTLLSINYTNLYKTSASFEELINSNVLIKRKFEEQFIAGIGYSFFYNQQVLKKKRNQIYFNGNIESAGNLLSLYKKIVANEEPSADNPSSLLGIYYAQFIRLDIDVRDYFNLGPKKLIATRFIAGWGFPYGNSISMPYIKQFFSGGAYSVRGFSAYSLGPGSYIPPDSLQNIYFLQQGGEIKLEGNIEYRFPIVGVLRGALFADAGNVWLNKNTPGIPNGAFKWNGFIKDIAVGLGFGLRVDLNFFVLRLDLGVPARKPWLPYGDRWVFHEINFSDKEWRSENFVFNLAFGYPF